MHCEDCIYPNCPCKGCINKIKHVSGRICSEFNCEFFITSDIKLLEMYLDGITFAHVNYAVDTSICHKGGVLK